MTKTRSLSTTSSAREMRTRDAHSFLRATENTKCTVRAVSIHIAQAQLLHVLCALTRFVGALPCVFVLHVTTPIPPTTGALRRPALRAAARCSSPCPVVLCGLCSVL